MILVLARKKTNRLQYILQLLLDDLAGVKFQITTSQEEYLAYEGGRFTYGIPLEGELYFAATTLLFESGISVKKVNYTEFDGVPAIFPVYEPASAFGFDVFAASFYLVSRYEEYLPHIKDVHGRFLASGSDAFRFGFLQKPVVNIWSLLLLDKLRSAFPQLVFRLPRYQFLPTIDIDTAFAYKHKGITRTIGGFVNSLRRQSYSEIKDRLNTLLNRQKDPFDTFSYLFEIQQKYKLHFLYFILMADYGLKDKNIPVNNRKFLQLIRRLADYSEIGIHPSYASSDKPSLIGIEIKRLSKVLHSEIQKSRQHFLRLEFPGTYRNLLNLDITDDYTMGYAEEPGFRASICSPFYFYDLDLDVPTHLRIHPFTIMDGTMQEYKKLSPEQSIELLYSLVSEIRKVNGVFIPLWHNQTLNDSNEWKGWLTVFEKMMELGRE